MATPTDGNACDICEAKSNVIPAVKWCSECEEKFCSDCSTSHNILKATKQHTLIDIEHYLKLPKSMLQIKNVCQDHGMSYTNFCTYHGVLCCPACVSGTGIHEKCLGIQLLKSVIHTAKSSSLLQTIEESLQDITDNLKHIIDDRQSNILILKAQRDQMVKNINELKVTIINHLDSLENQIITELQKTEGTQVSKLELFTSNLQQKFDKYKRTQEELQSIKEYGSDLQTFLVTKTLETEIERETSVLDEVIDGSNLERVNLNCCLDEKFKSLVLEISTLGTISVERKPPTVSLIKREKTQVQTRRQLVPIEEIRLSLKSSFLLTNVNIHGCAILPNKKIIIGDVQTPRLFVVNEDGETEKEIPVPDGLVDVAVISNNTVVVSNRYGVRVINIDTNEVENTINIGVCQGLEYYKGSLICCVQTIGVISVDISNSSTTTLVEDTSPSWHYYCTVHDDKIYITKPPSHTVTCCTIEGEKLWEFSNEEVINSHFGITIDTSSNVYIVSSNKTVILSPDGERHRTILTEADGLINPWAIYYDKPNDMLLIVNELGKGFLYEVRNSVSYSNRF